MLACLESLVSPWALKHEQGPLAGTSLLEVQSSLRDIWTSVGVNVLSDEALRCFLLACKRSEAAHPGCGMHAVYHWTNKANLPAIADHGLLVGSSVEGSTVLVAHGQALGPGIYASADPSLGKRYGDVKIICLALPGESEEGLGSRTELHRQRPFACKTFSHRTLGGVAVYRDRGQILACAQVETQQAYQVEIAIASSRALLSKHFRLLGISEQVERLLNTLSTKRSSDWRSAKDNPQRNGRLRKEFDMVKAMDAVLSVSIITKYFYCEHSEEEWEVELQLCDGFVVTGICGSADVATQLILQLRFCFSRDYPFRAPCVVVTSASDGASNTMESLVRIGEVGVPEILGLQDSSSWEPGLRVSDSLAAIACNAMSCLHPQVNAAGLVSGASSESTSSISQTVAVTVPANFNEILEASRQLEGRLGGTPHYPGGQVVLSRKKTRKQLFQGCTDYEHVCLTVLGLARLQELLPEIQRLNNGKNFQENPGTQLLERKCGFTMHADREGSAAILRDAPDLLLYTYQLAKSQGQLCDFFSRAFDRHHDPCLEGRMSLLVEYAVASGSNGPT